MEFKHSEKLVCLLACFMLVSLATCDEVNSYCSTAGISGNASPPKPALDYSYSTQIVGKWIHSKSMETIYEYYDHDSKNLAYDLTTNGDRFAFIYNYKEEYSINYYFDEYCRVGKIDTRNITTHSQRSLELLNHLGNVWKYQGTSTIRGVKVNQWRSCSSIHGWSNFTADYYFTTDAIPFRVELIGVSSIRNINIPIHTIYDYFLFNIAAPSPDVFKPTPGIICNNYPHMAVNPPLVMSASFDMEIIDPVKKRVTDKFVAFNKQKQWSVEQYDNKTHINDYSRGIQFTITYDNQKCTQKPLTRFEDSGQTVSKKGVIQMASLRHFLFDDGNFTYNGVYKARGIPCDVFTKRSNAAENLNIRVIEIYVTRAGLRNTNNQGSVLSSPQQPVRVVMKGGTDLHNTVVEKQYEIYDFDPQPFSYRLPFDLSPCYDEESTIEFEMELQGKITENSDWHWQNEMKTNLSESISKALKINMLRLTINDVIVSETASKARGSIFDKEEPYQLYQPVPFMKVNETLSSGHFYKYINKSNTPTLCADYCARSLNRPDDFPDSVSWCYAFQFDRSTTNCIFFDDSIYSELMHDENLVSTRSIDFYREATVYNNDWRGVGQVWNDLQRLVAKGLVTFTINAGDVVKATSVSKVSKESSDTDKFYGEGSPLKQFTKATGRINASPMEVITKIFKDACARHCLNALKYDCEAFQFDSNALKCSFYDSNLLRELYNQDSLKESPIHTYTRNYYSQFEKIPGRSILSPESDAVYTSVKDENACAELCVKEGDFYCQSFEMCGEACLLGRKHVFNIPPAKVKEDYSCNHFSRAYIKDYTKTQNKKALKSSSVIERGNIGVKECASLCSTSSSFDCDTFEFCDSDSLCRLTTKSVKNSNLQYTASGKCDVYSRKSNRHRFIYSSKQTSSGGHSPGSMGGVAIGMILVGIFVTVVGLLLFFRLRSSGRGPDGMSVGFSRSRMDTS